MNKLIKFLNLALILILVIGCESKFEYTPAVKIIFDNVDDDNIVEVPKGVTSYTAKITLVGTTKIRSMSIYEADVKTGAKGNKIANDTIFMPPVDTYSFEYLIDGLITNKVIMIEVEDEDLEIYSKKLLVKVSVNVYESIQVSIESSEAYYGPYYASWLRGRAYLSYQAEKYIDEIDFSFGNIVITGTDTIAAFVSPDKRKELNLPYIDGLKSCKFGTTSMTRAQFEAILPTDSSPILSLASPTQETLKAEAGKVFLFETDTKKGLVFIGAILAKKATLQQQDGTWVNNQTYHQLRLFTKTVLK